MNNELSILLHLKLFINLFNTWGTDKKAILLELLIIGIKVILETIMDYQISIHPVRIFLF